MNCQEFESRIPDLLRAEMAPGLRVECEAHVAECPACREEVESLRAIWDGLGAIPPVPGIQAPEAQARFRRRLRQQEPRRWRAAVLPMAAALVLALGGFAAGSWFTHRPLVESRFSMLRQGRISDRMVGVELLSQGKGPRDLASAEALLDLVEGDSSPQVRLSALEALYLFGSHPVVAERLARSLPHQTSSEVQAAQVDLLLALREKRALESLRFLLRDSRLSPESRRRLGEGLSGPL